MSYSLSHLVLMFFIYCFLGWIWECIYVSIQKREWVNRGFLYGPAIPVYGFGGITVLILTFPFKENIPLIFIIGLVATTTLEYTTGVLMEKIFHIRYWDYSYHKYNLNGYINLYVSITWGMFSVILVKILHPLIENILLEIPRETTEIISYTLTIIFVIDLTLSTQSALKLKEYLKWLTENNKLISILELKLNDLASNISSTSDELNELKNELNKLGLNLMAMRDKVYKVVAKLIRRNPTAVSKKFKEVFEDIKTFVKFKNSNK